MPNPTQSGTSTTEEFPRRAASTTATRAELPKAPPDQPVDREGPVRGPAGRPTQQRPVHDPQRQQQRRRTEEPALGPAGVTQPGQDTTEPVHRLDRPRDEREGERRRPGQDHRPGAQPQQHERREREQPEQDRTVGRPDQRHEPNRGRQPEQVEPGVGTSLRPAQQEPGGGQGPVGHPQVRHDRVAVEQAQPHRGEQRGGCGDDPRRGQAPHPQPGPERSDQPDRGQDPHVHPQRAARHRSPAAGVRPTTSPRGPAAR